MKRQEAEDLLYDMWESGEVPSNFTEDHSEYERAVLQVMEFDYLDFEDFF